MSFVFEDKKGVRFEVLNKCVNGITFKALAEKAKKEPLTGFSSMFGYNTIELADIILDYQKRNKEIKMTREEAMKKVNIAAYDIGSDKLFNGKVKSPEREFIDALEALGLLKFEEAKVDVRMLAALQHARGLNPEQTIKYLSECGYQIVRKGHAT